MKAEKVLKRYQAGERYFRGVNLRGQSFKGENLSGADFSEADIRGANFTKAILKDAKFSHAKAGLQRRLEIRLVISSWLLAALSGLFLTIINNYLAPYADEAHKLIFNDSIVTFITLAVVFILIIWPDFVGVAVGVAFAFPDIVVVGVAVAFFAFVAAVVAAAFPDTADTSSAIGSGIGAVIGSVARAFGVAGFVAITAAAAVVAIAVAVAGSVAVAVVAVAVAGAVGAAVVAVAVAVAVASTYYSDYKYSVHIAVVVAVAVTLLSAYIAWRALAGDKKYDLSRKIAIAFAATGGTNFEGADLTDANFTKAILKNTNFSKATLTRTRFYEAQKLNLARVDNTILATPSVLRLLVSGNDRGESYVDANLTGANLKGYDLTKANLKNADISEATFEGACLEGANLTVANLRGANLVGADLKEANLKNADISEATFQGACLEGANLTLTQAVGTNFTSAQMTGACVEAWNIEQTTILDNVECHRIYLLENPKPGTDDDRECRPSSGEFKSGEFTKLFQEVFDTVDLIFRNGIDWKAFVTAFKKVLVENEGIELEIQSIENKDDGVFVVKVKVPPGVNKEKIHNDFTQSYELALKEVEKRYKAELKAKDEQIVFHRQENGRMEKIIMSLANRPVTVEVNNRAESKAMNQSNDQSRKIDIGSVGGDFNASSQALNLGSIDISGTVTNTIGQLQESNASEASRLADLLKQLQAAIEKDENLSKEDKDTALEQVKVLAEAGQKPKEGAMQKAAKTAITMLKGTITGLPATATLVEACSKLLPLITKLFGLG